MTFNREFEEDPTEFLKKYALLPLETIIRNDQKKKIVTGCFEFFKMDGYMAGGNAEAVLGLRMANEGVHAYWLAYEAEKSKRAVLGTEARFMFTANMDGCSFGYGSKVQTGEVLVGHANAGSVGEKAEEQAQLRNADKDNSLLEGRYAQSAEQASMLRKKMQPGTLNILFPAAYMDPFHGTVGSNPEIYKYGATVVGVLGNQGWKFLCQKRTITTQGQFVLQDVIEI